MGEDDYVDEAGDEIYSALMKGFGMGTKMPMINALFACAMVENCSLAEAQKKCHASIADLNEAVKYRCTIATGGPDGKGKWYDYDQSIYECFKRLEMAN